MIRVLHYIPSIDETSGGVGAYMQLLAQGLGTMCELHVVTHKSQNERKLGNCQLHYIEDRWLPWHSCKKDFKRLLERIRPDVVHINACWTPLCALTAIWAKEAGYKVVYTPHGMLEPWIMRRHYLTRKLPAILFYQRKAIAQANLIHATAESERENLLRLGWNKNVHVIGNCVDIDDIPLKPSWKRTGEILFLSRIHVKKGINFLIEAVAAINEECKKKGARCPISRCTIAGDGDAVYMEELRDMATQLGVEHIMDFIGGVYGNGKWDLFKRADLFVLPTHSENFGIVVAEALACGTPVITTKGTPWHELETRHCGWWTDIGTEATTKALKEFISMPEQELEKMGKNGRMLVEEKYSTEIISRQFIQMYNKVRNEEYI